jgi:hypothetical protein
VGHKEELICQVEIERKDGTTGRFFVYQKGKTFSIDPGDGSRHIVPRAAESIAGEIVRVYGVKVKRPLAPGVP